ncbi:MAG TPA: hypothetical protein VKR57_09990 [Terriglobales bacterium]|nr:hypothetical protein [Terriglobales bacterium]
MKKAYLLLTLGLVCGSLALAQDSPGGQMTNPNDRGSAGANELHGCLSGTPGNYILTTTDTGTVIKLVGNENKLQKHVGEEVSITGKMRSDAGSPPPAMMSDQTQAPVDDSPGTRLHVGRISTLSKQCKESASH